MKYTIPTSHSDARNTRLSSSKGEQKVKVTSALTGALRNFLLPTDLDMCLFWMAATSRSMITMTIAIKTTNTMGMIPSRGSSEDDTGAADSRLGGKQARTSICCQRSQTCEYFQLTVDCHCWTLCHGNRDLHCTDDNLPRRTPV